MGRLTRAPLRYARPALDAVPARAPPAPQPATGSARWDRPFSLPLPLPSPLPLILPLFLSLFLSRFPFILFLLSSFRLSARLAALRPAPPICYAARPAYAMPMLFWTMRQRSRAYVPFVFTPLCCRALRSSPLSHGSRRRCCTLARRGRRDDGRCLARRLTWMSVFDVVGALVDVGVQDLRLTTPSPRWSTSPLAPRRSRSRSIARHHAQSPSAAPRSANVGALHCRHRAPSTTPPVAACRRRPPFAFVYLPT